MAERFRGLVGHCWAGGLRLWGFWLTLVATPCGFGMGHLRQIQRLRSHKAVGAKVLRSRQTYSRPRLKPSCLLDWVFVEELTARYHEEETISLALTRAP